MEKTSLLQIEGLACRRCGARVVAALRSLGGVSDVQMEWRRGRCRVQHADAVTPEELIGTVKAAATGTRHRYGARLANGGVGSGRRGWWPAVVPFLICLPCLIPFLILAGGVVGLSAVGGFIAANWLGGVLALGALGGLGFWWARRRRRAGLPVHDARA